MEGGDGGGGMTIEMPAFIVNLHEVNVTELDFRCLHKHILLTGFPAHYRIYRRTEKTLIKSRTRKLIFMSIRSSHRANAAH